MTATNDFWYTKQIPTNVWLVAGMLRIGLAKHGIEILPREFLVPSLCPRCSSTKVEETEDDICCEACGYSRPNVVKRGYNITVGELVGLATELLHHANSGTLMARLKTAVRTS